jgi:hypothetical protein
MNIVLWTPVASAAVSIASAAGSAYGWFRAHGERDEAARQAKVASDSAAEAAGALKQIAELRTKQDQRQETHQLVQEHDPWSIHPVDGAHADLQNNSDTAKYAVNVKIYAGGGFEAHNQFTDDTIAFVGPRRSARIGYIDLNGEVTAIITWHLFEDGSDDQPPQTITW